ncbi:MAG: hypothetical protein M3Q30_24735, partial [Actinomycetota bacterium]|nr:hypothetical protein [Actinomycetota bacterium]
MHLAVPANTVLGYALLGNSAKSWVWWAWIPDHQHEIFAYLREHMVLTALSVAYGFVISLP